MASTNPQTNLDTPVHVKISVNGEENRKFKLTLRDLGSNTLPNKLRTLLQFPDGQDVVFERYSDSSASFVVLDSANPSVYKQLYRAAKAKGKLRLRVTTKASPAAQMEEVPSTQPASDRLNSRRYVHPYVSEIINQEPAPSSRLSTLEDLNTLSTVPAAVAAPESSTVSSPQGLGGDPAYPDSEPEQKQAQKPYFWPVSDTPAWSDATKSAFDKATKQTTQESLRKIKEAIAARAANPNILPPKAENDEAPVPRFFSARDHCRAQHMAAHANSTSRSHVGPFKPITSFTICCNHCDNAIPNAHWHCSICDDGDFDLCLQCVERGVVCGNDDHWLIKRTVENGEVVSSTTETIAPKQSIKAEAEKDVPGAFVKTEPLQEALEMTRTCNSCVQIFNESQFVTCTACEDYDLCVPCFALQKHGHHPNHGFEPATSSTILTNMVKSMLAPGRNAHHWAVCDGCDKEVYGVRFKCLNCPDWDYCARCVKDARTTHPTHRFAPLYEPIVDARPSNQKHDGIYCDGPLCVGKRTYIRGDRYKCAVCHDTDFCANCEALPRLAHNRTHPLLKFRTPVRNVSVSTYGGRQDGTPMLAMGDQLPTTSSKATETNQPPSANAATQVHTVAEVKPESTETANEPELKEEPKEETKEFDAPAELNAHFSHDTIEDGTTMIPGAQFTQTWTMRNPGPHAWPAGCSVCFIGGDAMLNVDPTQPSHISHVRKATKSNIVEQEVAPLEKVDFTVHMRAPDHEGNAISYWRLKTPDGIPFGHKLWCDINMKAPKAEISPQSEEKALAQSDVDGETEQRQSQMIFPKLDKESPVASTAAVSSVPTPFAHPEDKQLLEDVESLGLDDDDDASADGFLTDEEYELIASGDEMEEAKNGKH